MDNFSGREEEGGRAAGHHTQDPYQNKTAENKGVWEFDYLLPGRTWLQDRTGRCSVGITRELQELGGVLTPPIVISIP